MVGVGHVGLFDGRQVAQVSLALCVVALLALVEEDRDGDRGEDADDDDDDQELDESEATLTLLRRLANTSEHCLSLSGRGMSLGSRADSLARESLGFAAPPHDGCAFSGRCGSGHMQYRAWGW